MTIFSIVHIGGSL